MRKIILIACLLIFSISNLCAAQEILSTSPAKFTLTSQLFKENGKIPSYCKYDKQNKSPSLSWENVPDGTKSYYIECIDLNVPWTHWQIYNIPASYTSLPEGVRGTKKWKDGILQGMNSFGTTGWGGPQPPDGYHYYEFTIYALDVELLESDNSSYIKKHALGQAKLVGKSD